MEEDAELSGLLLGIMEGYSDSMIPSLSELSELPNLPQNDTTVLAKCSRPKKRGRPKVVHETENVDARRSGSRKCGRPPKVPKKLDAYLLKERDRRQKMTDSYDILQALVPINFLPKGKRDLFKGKKATRERIVSGTITCIKSLKREIRRLEELKNSSKGKALLCTTWNSSINIMVSGEVSFFGIQAVARHSLVTKIFSVFQKHKVEVLEANVVVNKGRLTLCVTATANGGDADRINEKIQRDILNL